MAAGCHVWHVVTLRWWTCRLPSVYLAGTVVPTGPYRVLEYVPHPGVIVFGPPANFYRSCGVTGRRLAVGRAVVVAQYHTRSAQVTGSRLVSTQHIRYDVSAVLDRVLFFF